MNIFEYATQPLVGLSWEAAGRLLSQTIVIVWDPPAAKRPATRRKLRRKPAKRRVIH